MYLLTEWEGRRGKYLAEAMVKYVPVQPYLTQSIVSILSYENRTFPFFFVFVFVFFHAIKFAIGTFSYVAHFDRKVGIYIATKLFQFASRKEPYVILAGLDSFFRPCSCHRPHTRILSIALQ